MSAQRRTATRRDAAASPASGRPPIPTGNGAASVAAAPSARPPIPERPAKPAVERGRATEPRGRFAERFDSLLRTYRDTVAEMKKINWPDRETTKNLTIVVIGISIVLGILLGGIDYLLQALFEALP